MRETRQAGAACSRIPTEYRIDADETVLFLSANKSDIILFIYSAAEYAILLVQRKTGTS